MRAHHDLVANDLVIGAVPEPVRAMAERLRLARLNSANPITRERAQAEEAARKVVEPVKLEPVKAKRKVNGIALAKRAQKAGMEVASVLETPDGGALLTFGRKSDADTPDAEHIETADELRALI